MTISTLTSLAILKVNWDHLGADYIQNFIPFVAELARVSEDEIISVPLMQRAMRNEFGLRLPQNTLQMIISRAVKQGFFRRKSNVIYKVQEACDKSTFRETRDAMTATHDRVLSGLRQYAKTVHGKEWRVDDAEAALLDFLADSSLSLLYDIAERSNSPGVSEGQQFVVGSFVEHVCKNDTSLLEDLTLLARGNLLANAMYLPEPRQLQKKFRRTTVYFDTSFLIFAAGFASPDRAAPCLELINLLAESRAELKCFSDTYNEVKGILDACADRLRKGQLRDAYGPTIEYFIESGKTASDLELMSARLPEKLRQLGIHVVDRPSFDDFQYQVDESAFEEHIDRAIGYSNPRARIHDVDCVSAIARIRAGAESREVEECRAIFVTTNYRLAMATRQFFQPDSSPGSVALAINSYALANLLWLKNPTAAPELPRKLIVAHAYAATQPPAGLWKKYLAEIARLEENGTVTTEDYLLLRHTFSAKAALMDLTDGKEEGFTEGSIKEILEVALEQVRADLKGVVENERQQRLRTEESLEQVRADLKGDVENERQQRLRTEESLRKKEEASLVQRQRIRSTATSLARVARIGIYLVFGFLLIYGAIAMFPWDFPLLPTSWHAYVAPVGLLLFFVCTIANLIFGKSLKSLADWIEHEISVSLTGALFSFVGIDPASPLTKSETTGSSES